LGKALHALGRYKEELTLAQEIETEYDRPTAREYLIRANAGLRRVEEVERLVAESQGTTTGLEPDAGRTAAYELRAHGEVEASQRLCGRLADQFNARPGQTDRIGYRIDVLHCAGRLPDAIALARHLADSAGESLEGLGYGALYEAQAGNRDTAAARVARLRTLPKPKGDPFWGIHAWALLVFAALGDTAQALQQLREAYEDGEWGVRHYDIYHMELELEPIRSHPAAIAMMRPKE
jgi:tetratricopeptide (TPR) repeat protein